MAGSGVSRWQTSAIQKHLSDVIPKEEKKKVTAKSSRIGLITEMGALNVGFYPSHARSGHTVGTNQENYFDRSDPSLSLSAAKALAATRGRCAATFWKVLASPESVIFLPLA